MCEAFMLTSRLLSAWRQVKTILCCRLHCEYAADRESSWLQQQTDVRSVSQALIVEQIFDNWQRLGRMAQSSLAFASHMSLFYYCFLKSVRYICLKAVQTLN